MNKFYFLKIVKIKESINKLLSDSNDISCLVAIQEELLSWHFWLEMAVKTRRDRLILLKRSKRSLGNTKKQSSVIKASISICEAQMHELAKMKLWSRHIGNSIPHIYYDKNDLRPYAYSLRTDDLKELSGDIFGKEGQGIEYSCFKFATDMGIKALLNDLTSIMRNGDLTLMDKEFPFLLELKKSDACRNKAKQQVETIRAVQDYILTDSSKYLRGGRLLSMRVEQSVVEVSRINDFNNHLDIAKIKGSNISEIEYGVYCYSFFHGDFPKDLSFLKDFKEPIFISLNEIKNNIDNSLFYPYALSIKDPNILASFLCGKLSIYLFVDWEYFSTLAKLQKVNVEIEYPSYCLSLQSEGEVKAVSYTLVKALVEFSSLRWAIEEACNLYKNALCLHKGLDPLGK